MDRRIPSRAAVLLMAIGLAGWTSGQLVSRYFLYRMESIQGELSDTHLELSDKFDELESYQVELDSAQECFERDLNNEYDINFSVREEAVESARRFLDTSERYLEKKIEVQKFVNSTSGVLERFENLKSFYNMGFKVSSLSAAVMAGGIINCLFGLSSVRRDENELTDYRI